MMRGGPRMMCSPYLTGSLAVMLVIVSFNYWTVSTENNDLGKKIQELQQQLKTGTSHIQSLESDIKDLKNYNEDLKKSKNDERKLKDDAENKHKELLERKEELDQELAKMKADDELEERRMAEESEAQEKTVDSLRDELDSAKTNLTVCQSELAAERADKLLVPPPGAQVPPRHLGHNNLGPGQLPDLNPEAVSVVRKETQGAGLSILKPQHTAGLEAGKVGGISSTSQLPDTAHISAQEEFKLPGDNLDNAEDDSQIAQHENGPEGKEEIQDDDQNPDGQIDEAPDLDKQLYLMDKIESDGDRKDETLTGDDGNGGDFGASNEDVGEEKLENLKESLKKHETPTIL